MIVFSDHVKDKISKELHRLGLSEHVVREILRKPDQLLYDAVRGRFVAISWTHRAAIVYERVGNDLMVVTVIYSSDLEDTVERRRRAGRWI